MAVIYPIAFPGKAPATQRLILNRRQSATESPWTYAVQVVQTSSQWVLEWSWPRMPHPVAEAIAAWLLSLKGQVGTFRYMPRQAYGSTLTGKGLAVTAFSYNDTIRVSGWAANAEAGVRAGQFFTLGNQLLRVTEAGAFADSLGTITINFEPELRRQYTAGTTVNFSAPFGIFRLNSSEGIGYTLDPDRHPDFGTITAREVI